MNTNTNWVIAGKPDSAVLEIGTVYDIHDARKGTFTGRVISVHGEFAQVEVLEGKIHWASNENRILNSSPETVSIRASLVYLTERAA